MTIAQQRIAVYAQIQATAGYIGPKEPGFSLMSQYMGTGVSSGGDNEAESRGNVIIGPYAGRENGLPMDPVPEPPNPLAIFDSTIIGAQACEFFRGGVGTTAVGRYACQHAVGLGNNTGVGDSALRFSLTGQNSAFGYVCLSVVTTGLENNGFGNGCMTNLISGSYNSAFGNSANGSCITGSRNAAFGNAALYYNIGSGNTAHGYQAGYSLEAGDNNTFIGHRAGGFGSPQGTDVTNSIVIGNLAGTEFSNAIVIGTAATTRCRLFGTLRIHGAQDVQTNTIAGFSAGPDCTGGNNSLFGVTAGTTLTTGFDNTVLGWQALYYATTGFRNTAIGPSALQSVVTAHGNTAMGWSSGVATTGIVNSYYGYNSGASITSGEANTFVGYEAGTNALQLATATNSMGLGNGAYTTASNQVVVGNADVTTTILRGLATADSYSAASTISCRTAVTTIVPGGAQALAIGGHDGGGMGIYWGTGAPIAAAVQGSIYLRRDGSTTTNRFYINTDGGTTWAACTTES